MELYISLGIALCMLLGYSALIELGDDKDYQD
jgi:hypothetical protein